MNLTEREFIAMWLVFLVVLAALAGFLSGYVIGQYKAETRTSFPPKRKGVRL
jgi:membrane protein DedA with SNARE-associated domain